MIKNIITTFFSKGLVALCNFSVLLISARYLGASIVGQVSLLILNIAIVQAVNEIYTGPSTIFFIPRASLKKIYATGFIWTVACVLIINLLFLVFSIGVKELWLQVLILAFIISLNAFNMVIILAKERIRTFNVLTLMQPLILLLAISVAILVIQNRDLTTYVISLYISFGITLIMSSIIVISLISKDNTSRTSLSLPHIIKNGFINQLGNLAHTLSNRYSYYLISTTTLVGVYANATSLIESVLIIGSSISPIILTRVANTNERGTNARLTFVLSKICFLLSFGCVIIICFLPNAAFIYFFGDDFQELKTTMLYLSPGILCISLVSVISHYFSGLGLQKVQLMANCLGLLTTICTAGYFISRYQLIGACYAATLAYFVTATVFLTEFMRSNKFPFYSLFSLKGDLKLLKENK